MRGWAQLDVRLPEPHQVSVCFGRTALRVTDRQRQKTYWASIDGRDVCLLVFEGRGRNCPACHRTRRTRWKTIEAEANANYRGLLPYPVWYPDGSTGNGQGRPLRVRRGVPDGHDWRRATTGALRRVPPTTSDAPSHRAERLIHRGLTGDRHLAGIRSETELVLEPHTVWDRHRIERSCSSQASKFQTGSCSNSLFAFVAAGSSGPVEAGGRLRQPERVRVAHDERPRSDSSRTRRVSLRVGRLHGVLTLEHAWRVDSGLVSHAAPEL